MLELIVALVALVALVMFSGLIKRGIESVGAGVGSIGGAASHLVEAGADQAVRARIISNDSKQDTILSSVKQSAKRETEKATFLKGLNATQVKSVNSHEEWLRGL